MTRPAHQFRLASGPADSRAVRALDDLAFGPGTQSADPGELEAGVAAGDIHLVLEQDVLAGYLHADTTRSGRIYVAGVAVRPGMQERGLGSALIDHMLDLLGDERHLTPVVTVTAPSNVRMLKALFRRGFAARWFLPDHFSPGYHRFGCQLLSADSVSDPQEGVRVPVARLDRIAELMSGQGLMVRSLVEDGASEPMFELFPIRPTDFLPADPPSHHIDPAEHHMEQLQQSLAEIIRSSDKNNEIG